MPSKSEFQVFDLHVDQGWSMTDLSKPYHFLQKDLGKLNVLFYCETTMRVQCHDMVWKFRIQVIYFSCAETLWDSVIFW